jgi:hypothetical protein
VRTAIQQKVTSGIKRVYNVDSEGIVTTFRLVTYGRDSEVATEIVDGVERDDLAIRLLIANCTSKRGKLFADDVLIAEMKRGI